MSKIKLLPLCIALATPTAFAEMSGNKKLEELVVTANRFEQKLGSVLATSHVVTLAEIQRLKPNDLPSVLRRIPGISLRDSGGRGSSTGIFVRGNSSSQLLVLVDGVRTASATTGATALEAIPVEMVERIEVVLGPMSGIYGADAVAGVIQIFTKKGAKGFAANLNGSYGSYQTKDVGLHIRGGNDVVTFSAGITDESNGGFDRIIDPTGNIETDRMGNTIVHPVGNLDDDEFEETAANISLGIKLSDSSSFGFSYLIEDSSNEFDSAFGVADYFSDGRHETANVNYNHKINNKLSFEVAAGRAIDELQTPAFSSDITTDRTSVSVTTKYQIIESLAVAGGVDYYDEEVDTLADIPETDRDNTGLFAQVQYDNGTVALGVNLRNDDNSAYGENTTGGISAGYKLNEALQIVLSYGESFRAPSFNELYFPFYGDPSIQPEEAETFELAFRGVVSEVSWQLSAYQSDVTNLIAYDFTTRLAGNISEAELQGVEVQLSGQSFGWDWVVGLDYLDAYNSKTDSYLDDRVRFSANVEIAKRFGAFDVLLDWRNEHGRHDRASTIGGHSLLGLVVSYDIMPGLSVYAKGENLTDKNYIVNFAKANTPYRTEGRTGKIGFNWAL